MQDVSRQLAKFISEVDSGDFTKPSKITFEQFANRWLKDYGEHELAPKTLFRYKQILESRVYPAIGKKKLERIRPLDLIEFYNSLRKKHKFTCTAGEDKGEKKEAEALSENTIRQHHRIISAIFEKAIRWKVLKGSNPAKFVDAPKVEKKKANCYDSDDIQLLLKALEQLGPEELKYKAAVIIALMIGARLGEVLGLEWKDIHFDERYIEIRQASQYLPGKGIITKKPKSENSIRKVSANKYLLVILAQYQEQQRSKDFIAEGENRLFVSADNKPMHPGTISSWFPDFISKYNLPPITFHGLRHTSATYLISRGMDIETVAGRLGHSSSAITQNVYSHFLKSKDRQAAELMEEVHNPKKPKLKEKRGNKFDGNVIRHNF